MTATSHQNLFLRDDTFFGVCEAVGEDLHIPSNLLRLALAPLLIWNPIATMVGYFGVGVVVASIRFIFPNRRRGSARQASVTPLSQPEQRVEAVELAKAA